MKISVVTPLYRSAPYIEELHRRSREAIRATGADEHEIIFVNDASPDDSLEIAKALALKEDGVLVIDLARNFGQHKAIMAGLEAATGDYVFVMDSDLEELPEWIAEFFEEMTKTGCDVVYGVQAHRKRGAFYRAGRALFYGTLDNVSSIRFPRNIVTARLMSRRYVDALLTFDEREIWLAGLWHMTGYSQLGVLVEKRESSPTSYSIFKLVRIFVTAVTAFSTRPLSIISVAGILLSFLAFAYTAWIVFQKFVVGIPVEGWASVMAAVMVIGGLILFFNGVMAIYIANIFLEVKQRPRTIVKDIHSSRSDKSSSTAGRMN